MLVALVVVDNCRDCEGEGAKFVSKKTRWLRAVRRQELT